MSSFKNKHENIFYVKNSSSRERNTGWSRWWIHSEKTPLRRGHPARSAVSGPVPRSQGVWEDQEPRPRVRARLCTLTSRTPAFHMRPRLSSQKLVPEAREVLLPVMSLRCAVRDGHTGTVQWSDEVGTSTYHAKSLECGYKDRSWAVLPLHVHQCREGKWRFVERLW